MKRLHWCCLLSATIVLALGTAVRADDFRSGRVSDTRGSLAVRGPDDDDVSYVERNAVVRAGDVLWTDDDGRAEVELDRGAWVRLAEDTKLDVRSLPPSAEFRLWNGSVYFDLSDRVDGKTLLKTPVGDVEIERNSVVRVDLDRAESARVSVYNGRARAFPDSGSSVGLGTGERIYLEAGKPVSDPTRFDRANLDGFDRYQRERVDYFINRPLPRELGQDVIGARELHDYGSWVSVENATYWRPRCEPDWRPYSSGYWSYIPSCGYTWVDYSPWGYTTSHYGRWLYRPVYGWLWSPGYVWGPSYVSWSTYGSYCGWAPLDPWNRPCYYGYGNGFGLTIGTGNMFVDFRSWTFCSRDRFFYGRHHRNYGGLGRSFFAGHEIKLQRDGFRSVSDVRREIGIPRDSVRGLTVSDRGRLARERVLKLEDRVPSGRQRLIEDRFKVAFNRDRDLANRGSDVERLQRDGGSKLDTDRVLRGEDATRRLNRRGTDLARDNGGRDQRVTGQPDRNPIEGLPRDRKNDQANTKPNDRVGGNDRDSGFRRGADGRGSDGRGSQGGGSEAGNGRQARNGDEDGRRGPGGDRNAETGKPNGAGTGDGAGRTEGGPGRGNDRDSNFRRDGKGSGNGDRPGGGDRTGPNGDRQPGDGAGRGNDAQDMQRRENEKRENDRREAARRDGDQQQQREAQRRDAEKRDADSKRDADNNKRENDRREAERREGAQREAAQREAAQREAAQREAQRRDAEKRDNDRRESERRDNDRREAERRDNDRRESEKRDNDRRESEKRDNPRRGSEFPNRSFGTGNTGGSSPDDRFRRGGGGTEGPAYRDFRSPAVGTPSGSAPDRDSGFRRSAPAPSAPVQTAPASPDAGSRSSTPYRSYDRYPSRSTTPDPGSSYNRPVPGYGSSPSPYSRGSSPYSGGSSSPGRSYGSGPSSSGSSSPRTYGGGGSGSGSRSYGGGGGYSGGGSRSSGSGGGSSSRSSGSSDSGRGSLRR